MKFLVFLSAGLASIVFAQPPSRGGDRLGDRRPGPIPPVNPLERMLDGEWNGSNRAQFDFSDVEVEKGLATFDVSRKKAIGNVWVTCRGTGTYTIQSRLVHIMEVCPTDRPHIEQTNVFTLKLDFDGGFRGGRLELQGRKFSYTVTNSGGRVSIGDMTADKEETLTRERERQNGPVHRRRGGFGRN